MNDRTGPIHWVNGPELTTRQLHDILRLRVEVFVVEQACAYPELDGYDLLDTTWHAWTTAPGDTAPGDTEPGDTESAEIEIAAYVRLLFDHEPPQIGRVVTAVAHRGFGRTEPLLASAHARAGASGSYLEAQSHLAGWYARQGWVVCGDEFVEDGIAHVPMKRPSSARDDLDSGSG